MKVINDTSGALAIDQSAFALGVHEFSLLSRIQAGDIAATRMPSGEMAIPARELERISSLSVHSLQVSEEKPSVSDGRLGIEHHHSRLKRQGENVNYVVPGYTIRFTESEINGYRAAFGAIADEFDSVNELKKQIDQPNQIRTVSDKEVCTSRIGVWQVRSTLLNLGQSDILLCEQQGEFAVVERFHSESLYAKANGNAEIISQSNDAQQLTDEFKANAAHTLEFMASNLTAKAQKIVWTEYANDRAPRLMAAISERCRQVVSNEETKEVISLTQNIRQSHNRGMHI
jgi:hypothetical protein